LGQQFLSRTISSVSAHARRREKSIAEYSETANDEYSWWFDFPYEESVLVGIPVADIVFGLAFGIMLQIESGDLAFSASLSWNFEMRLSNAACFSSSAALNVEFIR